MPFQLKITFGGLCLFVPAPAAKTGKSDTMHVLLPATGTHHHGHAVEPHAVLLIYDGGYETGGPLTYAPKFRDIRGSALSGPTGRDGAIDLSLPFEIVDLTKVAGRRVDGKLLDGAPSNGVASRLKLTAGHYARHDPGAVWTFQGKNQEMAPVVEWTIDSVEGNELTWNVSGSAGGVPPLKPIDGAIELFVFNVPPIELPTKLPPDPVRRDLPAPNEEAAHFDVYYDVVVPRTPRELPRFRGAKPDAALGVSPFRCMTAQAAIL